MKNVPQLAWACMETRKTATNTFIVSNKIKTQDKQMAGVTRRNQQPSFNVLLVAGYVEMTKL